MNSDEELQQEKLSELKLACHPWQEYQASVLLKAFEKNKLHHAFIFFGVPKIGKFDFACAIAAGLLCKNPDGIIACGNCHSCHLVRVQTHPDFYVLQPEQGKQILVDEVRDLLSFMSKSASMSAKRIVIINQAQRMNLAAANALLKFLEEPGENVHLFLICDELDALLPTIKSRCQKLLFPELSRERAVGFLEAQLPGFDQALLEYSNNSVLFALELNEHPLFLQRNDILNLIVRTLFEDAGSVEVSKKFADFVLLDLLQYWNALCVDLLKLCLKVDRNQLRFKSVADKLEQMAERIEPNKLVLFIHKLQQEMTFLRRSAPLVQPLMLQSLLLQWRALAT